MTLRSGPHPMAALLAELLLGSDEAELREVVDRWAAGAPTAREKARYRDLGARLVDVRAEIGRAPTPPSRAELVAALSMMLGLAETHAGAGGR